MTLLSDILDVALLDKMIEERFVVRRQHPNAELSILNYTERCQFEAGAWNDVTLQCRGLIYCETTQEVVARPFRKFFNYGQRGAPELDLGAHACVTDKLDGSLGILYPIGDGYAIATRGSFIGEQAVHATDVLRRKYEGYLPPEGWTLLFAILYPTNRIVIAYGDEDDLFLLGAVQIATGHSLPAGALDHRMWPGPQTTMFDYSTLADALAAKPRKNAEGLVVHFLDSDERVKLKQEDYVALHRIVTGLSERTVWENLRDGKPLSELLEPLPDEFHEWTGEVAARLTATVDGNAAEVERAYSTILAGLPDGYTRKDFALQAARLPIRAALFKRHDGKDYRALLWDEVRPEPFLTPRGRTFSEDVA